MLIVTTNTVPGRAVHAVLGVAIGTEACTRNKFEAGMKALDNGDRIDRGRALRRDRTAAMTRMVEHATAKGANAVVGMRFDHREVSGIWMEICAYGTAVIVEPA